MHRCYELNDTTDSVREEFSKETDEICKKLLNIYQVFS